MVDGAQVGVVHSASSADSVGGDEEPQQEGTAQQPGHDPTGRAVPGRALTETNSAASITVAPTRAAATSETRPRSSRRAIGPDRNATKATGPAAAVPAAASVVPSSSRACRLRRRGRPRRQRCRRRARGRAACGRPPRCREQHQQEHDEQPDALPRRVAQRAVEPDQRLGRHVDVGAGSTHDVTAWSTAATPMPTRISRLLAPHHVGRAGR